jgi:hypothetical protein
VQGDAARKAIAFYLQAAKYAGDIPLTPNFKTPQVSSGGTARRRGRPRKEEQNGGRGQTPETGIPSGLHPALAGLLGDIPKRGETWTQEEHDNFKEAFDAVLKIAAPVSDTEPEGEQDWDE